MTVYLPSPRYDDDDDILSKSHGIMSAVLPSSPRRTTEPALIAASTAMHPPGHTHTILKQVDCETSWIQRRAEGPGAGLVRGSVGGAGRCCGGRGGGGGIHLGCRPRPRPSQEPWRESSLIPRPSAGSCVRYSRRSSEYSTTSSSNKILAGAESASGLGIIKKMGPPGFPQPIYYTTKETEGSGYTKRVQHHNGSGKGQGGNQGCNESTQQKQFA
jgi:hypothetical protein